MCSFLQTGQICSGLRWVACSLEAPWQACLPASPSGRSRCLRVDAGADQLVQLGNLQHLQLSKAEFPAALLAQMTTVQRVTLVGAWAVAPFPEPLWQHMTAQLHSVHPLPVTSSRVRDLMAAMIHLPQLEHLECGDMNDSSGPCMLRALTQLTELEITEQGMPTECPAEGAAAASTDLQLTPCGGAAAVRAAPQLQLGPQGQAVLLEWQ